MDWKHPSTLWLLPALGVLVVLYARAGRRAPRTNVVMYPQWLVAEAAGHARRADPHLPALFMLLALVAIIVGAARPVMPWPSATDTPIVLVIDVSRSMEENDVLPSRIEATKTAALDFLRDLPRSTKVALVTFGSVVTVVEPLSTDHARLRESVRNLATQLRTQLGTGLVEAVRIVTGEGPTSQAPGTVPPGSWPAAPPAPGPQMPGPGTPDPATPGADPDKPRAVAILLSDGRASDGVPPLEAAEEARRRGVRVHTVGVATTKDPSKLRSGYFGVLDDETLRAIADLTGGRYYPADGARRLGEVYRELARAIAWEKRPTEVTAIAAMLATALLVAAVVLRYGVYLLH